MEKVIVHQEFSGFSEVFKPYGAQDDVPDGIEDDVPSIVDQIWQAAPINAAAKAANGTSVILDLSVPASDVDDDGEFYKSPVIVKAAPASSSTLGKRVRPAVAKTTTRVDDDGFEWSESFDASGQLIDTRVLLARE
jgi:hypothetical protein